MYKKKLSFQVPGCRWAESDKKESAETEGVKGFYQFLRAASRSADIRVQTILGSSMPGV